MSQHSNQFLASEFKWNDNIGTIDLEARGNDGRKLEAVAEVTSEETGLMLHFDWTSGSLDQRNNKAIWQCRERPELYIVFENYVNESEK